MSERPLSFANRVSDLVLSSCRERDADAAISSILRDSDGRTVVRVRSGAASSAAGLLETLGRVWPLARTAVVENALDGSVEAEIVVPSGEDERARARGRAATAGWAVGLRIAAWGMIVAGALLCVREVYLDGDL